MSFLGPVSMSAFIESQNLQGRDITAREEYIWCRESWSGKKEKKVLLNGTVCSNQYADEAGGSWELGICESKLLTGFHRELSKPGESASSESLWG